jgi:CHAD domain-containing protein
LYCNNLLAVVNYKAYTNGLFSTAQAQLQQCVKHACAQKQLHHLRVTLKKIYALEHLLAHCYTGFTCRDKRLDKLYRRAGKIRKLQLMALSLKKTAAGKQGKKLQADVAAQLSGLIKRFVKRYTGHTTRPFAKTRQIIKDCLITPDGINTTAYLQWLRDKISSMLVRANPGKSNAHQIRILIKTLKYNLPLCTGSHATTRAEEKRLSKQATLLGNWHDAAQQAALLKKRMGKQGTGQGTLTELNRLYRLNRHNSQVLLSKFLQQSAIG